MSADNKGHEIDSNGVGEVSGFVTVGDLANAELREFLLGWHARWMYCFKIWIEIQSYGLRRTWFWWIVSRPHRVSEPGGSMKGEHLVDLFCLWSLIIV